MKIIALIALFVLSACASRVKPEGCYRKISVVEFKDKNLCFDPEFQATLNSLEKKLELLEFYFKPENDFKLKVIIQPHPAGPYSSYFIKDELTIVLGVFEDYSWKNLSTEVFVHEASHAYLDFSKGYELINAADLLKESIPDLMVELTDATKDSVGSCEQIYHRRYLPHLKFNDDKDMLSAKFYKNKAHECCSNSYALFGRERYFCDYLETRFVEKMPEEKVVQFKAENSNFIPGLVLRDLFREWYQFDSEIVVKFFTFTRYNPKLKLKDFIQRENTTERTQSLLDKYQWQP